MADGIGGWKMKWLRSQASRLSHASSSIAAFATSTSMSSPKGVDDSKS